MLALGEFLQVAEAITIDWGAIVNMGSAGAVIITVIYFLKAMERRDDKFTEALKFQTDEWRRTLVDIECRRDQNDERRDEKLNETLNIFNGHDLQAKQILTITQHTEERVGRMEPKVDRILEAVTQPTVARKGPSSK